MRVGWDGTGEGQDGGASGSGRVWVGKAISASWVCVVVQKILRGGGCWGVRQEAVHPICFGTYNIRNSQNGGIESTLRGMFQANVDLVVRQNTKVTQGINGQELSGYRVVASETTSAHSGGIFMLFRAAEDFSVEAPCLYGANIVSFQLASGGHWWYIVGCYLAPDDTSTI